MTVLDSNHFTLTKCLTISFDNADFGLRFFKSYFDDASKLGLVRQAKFLSLDANSARMFFKCWSIFIQTNISVFSLSLKNLLDISFFKFECNIEREKYMEAHGENAEHLIEMHRNCRKSITLGSH